MLSTNTYVSLFSSGGLGCYGFKEEGFACVATAELLERRMAVQRANGVSGDPEGYVVGDLTDVTIQTRIIDRVAQYKSTNPGKELTVVLATPPCQGMSVANHKKSSTEIVRNSLVVESLLLISTLKPRYFVLENVRSFLKSMCVDVDGQPKTIGSAIADNMSTHYNFSSKVLNLKDYGSPSSRTRTLVIGVRRDIADVSPLDLFPEKCSAKNLFQLIGDLEPLKDMGQMSSGDIYHGFKAYKEHMRAWIKDLKPGESAFDNPNPELRPHRMANGLRVENQRKNGDKYTRARWENTPPCVHTRNDILSSQATIHPIDDRVFSIRELMRFMGVPETFKWTSHSPDDLNSMPESKKVEYLKRHEMNIRQCLGEGVPTPVFQSIAKQIAHAENAGLNTQAASMRAYETSNSRRTELSAYYTRPDIAFSLARELPEFKKKRVRILEPSVGVGSLLPAVLNHYQDKQIDLVLVDMDETALRRAVQLAESMLEAGSTVRSVCGDFLTTEFNQEFDLVVGNPPFGKTRRSTTPPSPTGSDNLFSVFLHRSMQLGANVSLIIPKSFMSAPEYWQQRSIVSRNHIRAISDFGNRAFKDVRIETIGLHVGPAGENDTLIDSIVVPGRTRVKQSYISDPSLPTWVIYRNDFFDRVLASIKTGSFDVYRDRSISSKHITGSGDWKVLKARNIACSEILEEDIGFVDESVVPAAWRKLRDRRDLIAIPNLSYYPRAARVPKDAVPDGSAAILIPRVPGTMDSSSLAWFSSQIFYFYYRIARNFSVRSLNIDSCSVFYFGLPLDERLWHTPMHVRDPKLLFELAPKEVEQQLLSDDFDELDIDAVRA